MRRPEIVVLSDLHLGTLGCRAEELLAYISDLQPGMVVLAGDIIDIVCHQPNYWPETHMRIVRKLLKFSVKGIPVYYMIGNHDAHLQRYVGLELGTLHLLRELELDLGGERYLIVHGDQFDPQHGFWNNLRRKAGGFIYDRAMWANRLCNRLRKACRRPPLALTPELIRRFGSARAYVEGFADRAAAVAWQRGCQGVICGHIHIPRLQTTDPVAGRARYLNCGDWVEHCSALEFANGRWRIHRMEAILHPVHHYDDDPLGSSTHHVTAA